MSTNAGDLGSDPRVGTVAAGKYRIVRFVGGGAMGRVYEAENVAIGKRVALKFVAVEGPPSRARFHREARAVAAVESPHIVQIFDTAETAEGEPFLVMELLSGEDLAARLGRGRLTVSEALDLAAQALRGLKRAHAAGIVHRDLKPENLFLARDEEGGTSLKLVDFGLSKILGGRGDPEGGPASISVAGAVMGTPLYMSPEQIDGAPDVDHRADLWAIGAILYEALSGAPAFAETTFARLCVRISERDVEPLSSRAPGVPRAVDRLVARALTRDRAQRFQSAEEMLAAVLAAAPPSRPSLSAPGAELMTFTQGAATLWITQTPAFSIWRGEVAAPDRLRIEARDGSIEELRLAPVGALRLGRTARVGEEENELVYADVASRLAATLRHDGVRWWLRRRDECSVPVQIGARSLARGEEAPLTHGTFVSVGGMRATFVDRRYVAPAVPAGAVDPATGLLARAGIEQEIAAFLQRRKPGGLLLLRALGDPSAPATTRDPGLSATLPSRPRVRSAAPPGASSNGEIEPDFPMIVAVTLALHRASPSLAVGSADGAIALIVPGSAAEVEAAAERASAIARSAGLGGFVCGYWLLAGEGLDAGREMELSLHALDRLIAPEASIAAPPSARPVALRDLGPRSRPATAQEIEAAEADGKRVTMLFGIEEQSALGAVGPQVVAALEKELTAVVATHAGAGALVGPLSPGVVVASVSRKIDPNALGASVQCDWHARPPILDGKAELPRALSWEAREGRGAAARAADLARECADPHGVLSALSGGLPYPIAGRVHGAIVASSAVERVKMLFDVLEGTWRFMATVLVAAVFARREAGPGLAAIIELGRRLGTRDGYALGSFRELARAAARDHEGAGQPIGALARDVLGVRLGHNQTFETLSNLMQAERNAFAHGQYGEARAATDLPEFEQMTRTLLRALRPLSAWTLVTVEKTEPDPYGDLQAVEYLDHTGAFNAGTRRRIGLNSPVRLANVVYLARWREGLVLPLEPMIRRVPHGDRFELFWMDHLPRASPCQMSSVVGAEQIKVTLDPRRLPPLMRQAISGGG